MSLAFKATSASASGTGTSATVNRPAGVAVGDLLVVVLGFEGVASGSGPWVVPGDGSNPNVAGPPTGWQRICYQAPSATGCGLEVWAAVHGSGTFAIFNFTGSLSYVAQTSSYSGEYNPTGRITDGAIRTSLTAQVTGNNAAAPSVYMFLTEIVIACAAQQVDSSGFTAPAGYSQRFDTARGGSHGNVEIALVDKQITSEGDTGAITWTSTASPSGAKGATATLAARPSVTLAPASGALSFRFPVAT